MSLLVKNGTEPQSIEAIVGLLSSIPTQNTLLRIFSQDAESIIREIMGPNVSLCDFNNTNISHYVNLQKNENKYKITIKKLIDQYDLARLEALQQIEAIDKNVSILAALDQQHPESGVHLAIVQVNQMKSAQLNYQIQAATSLYVVLEKIYYVHLNMVKESIRSNDINIDVQGANYYVQNYRSYIADRTILHAGANLLLIASTILLACFVGSFTLQQDELFYSSKLLDSVVRVGELLNLLQLILLVSLTLSSGALIYKYALLKIVRNVIKRRYLALLFFTLMLVYWAGLSFIFSVFHEHKDQILHILLAAQENFVVGIISVVGVLISITIDCYGFYLGRKAKILKLPSS